MSNSSANNRDEVILLNVDKLYKDFNPFINDIWNTGMPISKNEIEEYVSSKNLLPPYLTVNDFTREDHIARIAWFVVNGWRDYISIDFGVPSLGYCPVWPIVDGNHRYAASIVRGDKYIRAIVAGELSVIDLYKE